MFLFKVPILYRIIFFEQVKILSGRMLLTLFKEPDKKSLSSIEIENLFLSDLLVIWHNNKSSPSKSRITKAGLFFELDKSEKGKGTTTISPFTNWTMLHLPQISASPFQAKVHSPE